MRFERLLRIIALVIAALALIDPTLTFASRQRRAIAMSIVESPSLSRTIVGAETGLTRVQAVRAQLATALGDTFDVREGPAPDAAAQVLIGDGSFPADTPMVEGDGVPIHGVAIDTTSSPNVRVLRIDAPVKAALTARMRVTAIVEARGMVGRTSAITLRADDLEMARVTHAWTQPIETASIALDAVPFRTGVARLTVSAEPLPVEATAADNTADTAIDITADKIAVLFVEARPSWMTRFARQALETDDRFAIKTSSRVSRGLTATTPETPQALTLAALEPFAAVIVGAPDALTRADVEALRQFARVRGGLVIFAPDQRPSGAYVDLLPARAFDEKLQGEASPLPLHGPDIAFAASELALARDLLPGSEVLAHLGNANTSAPVIIASPAGDGEVVFIGALDAWRFRANPGFDATWRQLIATRAARVPPPIDITLDTPIVAPGAPIAISVRVRKTLIEADGSILPLIARLGGSTHDSRDRDSGDNGPGSVLRLWPADQPGRFTGRLNAPLRTGVYAVSVGFERGGPVARAMLLVAPRPQADLGSGTGEALRTFVDAHGGRLFAAADLPQLIAHLQQHVHAGTIARARHPFRSAWWIAPFAACLGGEWWLRRRRGQR